MIHPSKFSSTKKKTFQFKIPFKNKPWFSIGLILGLLALLILFGKIAWNILTGVPALPHESHYPYNTSYQERINILFAVSDFDQSINYLSVASIGKNNVEYLNLNSDWSTQVVQGRGNYRLGEIKKLGDLDNGLGMNLLRDSVSRMLAIPIDGYVVVDQTGSKWVTNHLGRNLTDISHSLSNQKLQLLLAGDIPTGVYSSFNRFELWKLSNKFDRNTIFEEPHLSYYINSDGSWDSVAFDNNVGSKLEEESIAHFRPRVKIVNASGVAGSAIEIARYIHNLGGEVSVIESSNQSQPHTTIIDHIGTNLSSRIGSVLRSSIMKKIGHDRADVDITLGQDIALFF